MECTYIYSPIGRCEQLFVRLGSAVSRVLNRDSCFVDISTAEWLLLYLKVFSQGLELSRQQAGDNRHKYHSKEMYTEITGILHLAQNLTLTNENRFDVIMTVHRR